MKEFVEFKKIPRLSREIVVTEKIDGTNGVIYIDEDGEILVGSRTRWIGEHTDNYNFWHWVKDNTKEILKLGVGTHYGEWWGQGIQRRYDLKEKRFSLFNTARWGDDSIRPKCCHVTPVLYTGIFNTLFIDEALHTLKEKGSQASPGFMRPEGVVIFHKAGNLMFKKTIEKDAEYKGKS